ncbi:hypothetical protein [Streptomyces sp. Rer75]|uniref:hypothetical protein n=1 Tax=Streptomyces sp. Rer75 TaxID=2750011 RepID=UPI0015CFCDFD|nr:hypothetical protein [Streptomyces sp. Rer75]QLH19338.1 hypothetical protein HYQ63_00385 [Streptomyces sp. Rer75]
MLRSSARTFANLEDSANLLANVADTRKNLEDSATVLAGAARSSGLCRTVLTYSPTLPTHS